MNHVPRFTVFKDHLDHKDALDPREIADPRETREIVDLRVAKGPKDPAERREIAAPRDHAVHLVPLGQRVARVNKAHPDHRDPVDTMDAKVHAVKKDLLAHVAPGDARDLLDLRDHAGLKVTAVLREIAVHLVAKDQRDARETRETRVAKDHVDLRDLLDPSADTPSLSAPVVEIKSRLMLFCTNSVLTPPLRCARDDANFWDAASTLVTDTLSSTAELPVF